MKQTNAKAIAERRAEKIMERLKEEEEERAKAREMIAEGAEKRAFERHADSQIATQVTGALFRSMAREKLFPLEKYPNGPHKGATHILRCIHCATDIMIHTGIPFSEKGKLSVLKCKKCWRAVPFADSSCRMYDQRAVVLIDDEVERLAKLIALREGKDKEK